MQSSQGRERIGISAINIKITRGVLLARVTLDCELTLLSCHTLIPCRYSKNVSSFAEPLQNIRLLLKFIQQIVCVLILVLSAMAGRLLECSFSRLLLLMFLPAAYALPASNPFPDITFHAFSEFIGNSFGSKISLATVLTVLFTLTNNTDLLNLHAHQQHSMVDGEHAQVITGWMKSLAQALEERLQEDVHSLFLDSEERPPYSTTPITNTIGIKLDALSKLLKLNPFNKQGQF
jgi:hypothetical protein